MHNYHDSNKKLPFAALRQVAPLPAMIHTYVVPLWPYMEQGPLYDAFDQPLSNYANPNGYIDKMDGAIAKDVPIYWCPSETGRRYFQMPNNWWRTNGHYVLNWGNWTLPSAVAPTVKPTGDQFAAPFVRRAPRATTLPKSERRRLRRSPTGRRTR